MQYEVANKATNPCLGERRLEVSTEGAPAPRMMAIQVADVHKPLLSLSQCADAGFESRFGRTAGCLIDGEVGEVIPLQRRGNLYYLKTDQKFARCRKAFWLAKVTLSREFLMRSIL